MGVLDDTVLGINGSDIESIASETCNCHPVSTESESEWRSSSTAKRYASVTRGDNSAMHCLHICGPR
jgi:hypothetical protein